MPPRKYNSRTESNNSNGQVQEVVPSRRGVNRPIAVVEENPINREERNKNITRGVTEVQEENPQPLNRVERAGREPVPERKITRRGREGPLPQTREPVEDKKESFGNKEGRKISPVR